MFRMIGLGSIVMRHPDVMVADLDQETMLMSVEQGSYFNLSSTSRDIWARFDGPTLVRDLCAGLACDYDAEAGVIEAQTLAFLNHLCGLGLIVEVAPTDR
jgi:hypothetical protein